MDKCNSCQSERILLTSAKCSDLFSMVYKGKGGHGYVPDNLFFGKDGYGDYAEFNFCLDCGKIQAKFPVPESQVLNAMEKLDGDKD